MRGVASDVTGVRPTCPAGRSPLQLREEPRQGSPAAGDLDDPFSRFALAERTPRLALLAGTVSLRRKPFAAERASPASEVTSGTDERWNCRPAEPGLRVI